MNSTDAGTPESADLRFNDSEADHRTFFVEGDENVADAKIDA